MEQNRSKNHASNPIFKTGLADSKKNLKKELFLPSYITKLIVN